jgi:hypothetical protein
MDQSNASEPIRKRAQFCDMPNVIIYCDYRRGMVNRFIDHLRVVTTNNYNIIVISRL